jgi:type II secretory pathway component PulF
MWASSERATMYHNLSTLLDAGMPIIRALGIIAEGLKGQQQRVFANIRKSVQRGTSLAQSMSQYKGHFGRMDIDLVETAEMSGNLGAAFAMLSNWYEFRARINRIILSGLVLPAAIILIASLVVPLPGLVLGTTGLTDFILAAISISAWVYLPVAVVLAILFLGEKIPFLRLILDSIILRIPILGQAVFHVSIARYCRAFNMLYKAALPITQCTVKATEATGNAVVAGLFKGGAASVAAGDMAYKGFSKRLPSEYLSLWSVGEESGQLDKTVDKIAEIAEDRAQLYFTEFARWLPRFVYAIICAIMIIMIFKAWGKMMSQYSAF